MGAKARAWVRARAIGRALGAMGRAELGLGATRGLSEKRCKGQG